MYLSSFGIWYIAGLQLSATVAPNTAFVLIMEDLIFIHLNWGNYELMWEFKQARGALDWPQENLVGLGFGLMANCFHLPSARWLILTQAARKFCQNVSQLTQCHNVRSWRLHSWCFQGWSLCFMAELILMTLPQSGTIGASWIWKDKQWLTNRQAQRFVRVHQGSLCLRSTSKYWYWQTVFPLNKMLDGLELCSEEAFT